jgi:hypothetical protein
VAQQSFLDWVEDGELVETTQPEQHFRDLARLIAAYLGIDLGEALDAVEVYTAGDLSFLERLREGGAFSARELAAIRRQILSRESYYIPRLRIAYLAGLSMNHAAEEAAHFLRADVDYWRLYTGMIAPLREWASSAPSGAPSSSVPGGAPTGSEESEPDIHISALCADYGIFEGNFVRSVLKVANVLDELCALATLESDTKLLETLEGARTRLVRDVVVPDSLYLHL